MSSVRTLFNESNLFLSEKAGPLVARENMLRADVEESLHAALVTLEERLKKVYEIGGLPRPSCDDVVGEPSCRF